jgi:hypothetical protein
MELLWSTEQLKRNQGNPLYLNLVLNSNIIFRSLYWRTRIFVHIEKNSKLFLQKKYIIKVTASINSIRLQYNTTFDIYVHFFDFFKQFFLHVWVISAPYIPPTISLNVIIRPWKCVDSSFLFFAWCHSNKIETHSSMKIKRSMKKLFCFSRRLRTWSKMREFFPLGIFWKLKQDQHRSHNQWVQKIILMQEFWRYMLWQWFGNFDLQCWVYCHLAFAWEQIELKKEGKLWFSSSGFHQMKRKRVRVCVCVRIHRIGIILCLRTRFTVRTRK